MFNTDCMSYFAHKNLKVLMLEKIGFDGWAISVATDIDTNELIETEWKFDPLQYPKKESFEDSDIIVHTHKAG